jgi:hypothetical protein
METRGRPKGSKNKEIKVWTDENIERAERLMKIYSASQVGKMFNKSKSSILGILYREKIKKGYIPPPDSKYAHIRKYHRGFR